MNIEQLLIKQQIQDLCADYAHGIDRLQMSRVRSVFFDDATTHYDGYSGDPDGFVTFAYDFLKDLVSTHHFLGQIKVDIDGDVAFGEVYFQAFHRIARKRGDEDLVIAGRYIDRYEQRAGIWRIAHRTLLTDWTRRTPAADTTPAPPLDTQGRRGDADLANRPEELRAR